MATEAIDVLEVMGGALQEAIRDLRDHERRFPTIKPRGVSNPHNVAGFGFHVSLTRDAHGALREAWWDGETQHSRTTYRIAKAKLRAELESRTALARVGAA